MLLRGPLAFAQMQDFVVKEKDAPLIISFLNSFTLRHKYDQLANEEMAGERLPERDESGRLQRSELRRKLLFRRILSTCSLRLMGDATTELQ